MLVAAFAMSAALTAPGDVRIASGPRQPRSSVMRHGSRSAAARPAETAVIAPGDLYSARAKRRIASFLRMRLLELRLRGLRRAALVIEHRLSLDDLLRSP